MDSKRRRGILLSQLEQMCMSRGTNFAGSRYTVDTVRFCIMHYIGIDTGFHFRFGQISETNRLQQ
jgi:hypothetical protein